jgi:hypothetical protein
VKSFLKILPVVAFTLFAPSPLFACAACYGGNIDSPLADGMNWGIFTLLGMIVPVLACFLVFFIHLIRKSEAMAADAEKTAKPTDL